MVGTPSGAHSRDLLALPTLRLQSRGRYELRCLVRSRLCEAARRALHRARDTISILRRLFAVGVALRRACEDLLGDQPGILPDRRLDLRGHVGIGLQKRLGVFAALAEALAVIGEPGAGF